MITHSDRRILLVDNYDSYTWNIFQAVVKVSGIEPEVISNDGLDKAIRELNAYERIIIGPGPGDPRKARDVGRAFDLIEKADIPILGVCLGHQIIALHCGARLFHLELPAHGRVSDISHDGSRIYVDTPTVQPVVRYHSLAVSDEDWTDLKTTSRAHDDGVVMGLEAPSAGLFGLQFHPESILTTWGEQLIGNFLDNDGDMNAED